MSNRQIRYRMTSGRWTQLHESVFRLSAASPTWEGSLLAPILATGGVASHRAAAALWNLELYTTPRPEITVPHGSWSNISDVLVHQTTQWASVDMVMRRGLPTTGIERTILDCGAVVGARTVERLTGWDSLFDCLLAHSRQGRTGCGRLRQVLAWRLGDGTIPLSDFSRVVTNLLVDGGVRRPVLEHRIHDRRGGFIMQVDLAWPDQKKAWELDGLRYHFGRTEIERDRRKRNAAKSEGWNIQEILWSMYADNPRHLVQLAHDFLGSR